jgi:hypothetical protein
VSQDLLLTRIRGEYREMPGLGLTLAQAARLFGLDPTTCEAVLQRLVTEQSVYQMRDGRFVARPADHPSMTPTPSAAP